MHIGIIGGSGIYDILEQKEYKKIYTPYGATSDLVAIGKLAGKDVVFISRHGSKHTIPPHLVNNRANIWALKELGVKRIISICATGSLKEDYRPGDIVIPDQFIDFGKNVETFYEGGKVVHVSMADPFCPELRALAIEILKDLDIRFHDKGTYVRISGPQFSTRAASRMYRMFGDIIGMTGASEAILARELALCNVIIATITDYDVWAEKPVSAEEVIRVMKENEDKIKKVIKTLVLKIPKKRSCNCKNSLVGAEI
ncbi:MAG: S-methyl-5'-thioadenosine phosphorylase [Candidatus Pacearchaeota archaeon]